MVVYVEGEGGEPLTVVVCVDGERGTLDKHGALIVVFQWFFEENTTTQWFCVATHSLRILRGRGENS